MSHPWHIYGIGLSDFCAPKKCEKKGENEWNKGILKEWSPLNLLLWNFGLLSVEAISVLGCIFYCFLAGKRKDIWMTVSFAWLTSMSIQGISSSLLQFLGRLKKICKMWHWKSDVLCVVNPKKWVTSGPHRGKNDISHKSCGSWLQN